MNAWEIFDRLLAERAETRRRETGFGGQIVATVLEDVRDAAREAFTEETRQFAEQMFPSASSRLTEPEIIV